MGYFAKWLLADEQKELFDYLYANVLNVVFLAIIALVLWPFGRAWMAYSLAKGYWVFWCVMILCAIALVLFRRIFRIDLDTRYDAYVLSALAVSSFLQAGWSAFAALTVQGFVAGAPFWTTAALYVVGFLSCYVAFGIVCAFYMGSLYKTVNLPLSVVSFVVFSLWPAAGRTLYGWFFDLF